MNNQELLYKVIEKLSRLPFSKEKIHYFYLLAHKMQFHEVVLENIENGVYKYCVETVNHQNKYIIKNEGKTCFLTFPYVNQQEITPVIQINPENHNDDIDIAVIHEIVHLLSSYDEMQNYILTKKIGINQYQYLYKNGKIIECHENIYHILNEILTEIMTRYLCIRILQKEPSHLSFSTLNYNRYIEKRLSQTQINFSDFMIAYFTDNIIIIEKVLGHSLEDMEKICKECYANHKELCIDGKEVK